MDSPTSHAPLHLIKSHMSKFFKFLFLTLTGLVVQTAFAQGEEAFIRKTLKERMPHIHPIDEIKRTPMTGLFELRVDGTEIFYTDASANFLIQGRLIDTKNQRDLTEERIQKIMAVPTPLLETIVANIADQILAANPLAEMVYVKITKQQLSVPYFEGTTSVDLERKRN